MPIAKNINRALAIPALPAAILVNPKKPAINAKIAKMTAHFKNILHTPHFSF